MLTDAKVLIDVGRVTSNGGEELLIKMEYVCEIACEVDHDHEVHVEHIVTVGDITWVEWLIPVAKARTSIRFFSHHVEDKTEKLPVAIVDMGNAVSRTNLRRVRVLPHKIIE